MRTIEIMLHGNDEELIRLYATRGRKHYVAVLEDANGRYRIAERNAGCSLQRGVTRIEALGHAQSVVDLARTVDGITMAPIETSSAIYLPPSGPGRGILLP